MKHIIILGDGMADWHNEALGGATLLQHAHTPNSDKLARMGRNGLLKTVADGFHPGSEVANSSILGYDQHIVYQGRGPLEAAAIGVRLEDGDLIYVNYNSVRYTYQVKKKVVVEPSNVASLVVDTDKPLITLVTCTPLGTSRYRLLVTGEQISPSYENAGASEDLPTTHEDSNEMLPSNEPSFFEGIWNWLTGA